MKELLGLVVLLAAAALITMCIISWAGSYNAAHPRAVVYYEEPTPTPDPGDPNARLSNGWGFYPASNP